MELSERIYNGDRAREVPVTMPHLTAARLRELFSYSAETGAFTRIVRVSNVKAGVVAGSTNRKSGYVQVRVDGVMHKAHRLAFLYMNGKWPGAAVDHRDGVKSNNAWANLREAYGSANHFNVPARPDNKTGVKGVCWHKPSKKYIAQARLHGKHVYLGIYSDVEEAGKAYRAFAEKHHGEFLHEHQ